MYCPYDNIDHPPDAESSTEHIIPYALGGSNQFTIMTCRYSNNTFGRDIDAPFLRVFPVAYERFTRNIDSSSGNLPALTFAGTTELSGRTTKIEYEITAERRVLFTDPIVMKTANGDNIQYQIQAAPLAVEEMLRNIDAKAVRSGKRIFDTSGRPVTVNELLEQAGVQKLIPLINVKWDYRQWAVAAQKEFIKIALGAVHFILGEDFSRSEDASLLRRFLFAAENTLSLIPIRGNVWPATIASPLSGLQRVFGQPENHIVALLNLDSRLQLFISLFGNMNGLVMISEEPEICQKIAADDGVIVEVDPLTRSFQRRTYRDLLRAMSEKDDNEGLSEPTG